MSKKNQLIAYKHKGFWQCMDTLKDKILLNNIWREKNPPGKNDKKFLQKKESIGYRSNRI